MAFIFKYPINYEDTGRIFDANSSATVKAVSDNNYNTASALTDYDIHIDADGDGTGTAGQFTHLFLKTKGVGSFSLTFTGGNLPDVANHAVVETLSNGRSIVDVFEFQNYLYKAVHTATPEAQSINLTLTAKMGATISVAEIMVLRELYEFDLDGELNKGNAGVSHSVRRLAQTGTTVNRSTVVIPAIGKPRNKNKTTYTLRFFDDTDLDAFFAIYQNESQVVFAPEPLLYPRLVYPAMIEENEIEIAYESISKVGSRTFPATFVEL